jgi:hypothetical protein
MKNKNKLAIVSFVSGIINSFALIFFNRNFCSSSCPRGAICAPGMRCVPFFTEGIPEQISLILVLLSFTLAIVAVVFGILSLKSYRIKMAICGLLLGVFSFYFLVYEAQELFFFIYKQIQSMTGLNI